MILRPERWCSIVEMKVGTLQWKVDGKWWKRQVYAKVSIVEIEPEIGA